MKGVVLAGGLGTRFHPVTKVLNKHLLDVFDEPMVFYPIRTLEQTGITDITVVSGDDLDQFKRLLDGGHDLGVNVTYAYQEGSGGIADALARAEEHIGDDLCTVVLGDNIFQDDITPFVHAFEQQERGAKILLKEVAIEDAMRFGVAEVHDGRIVNVEEKPREPRSNLVQTGCYMYDRRVFDLVRTLQPSARGELEITDLNNLYIAEGTMTYDVLQGWWTDAGTPASKLKASILVALQKGVVFHQ